MLYFDRTDLPERIDVDKTNQSEEYNFCLSWHFLNNRFKFQRNISILNSKGADYSSFIIKNFLKLK